jgi:hypothetical protein
VIVAFVEAATEVVVTGNVAAKFPDVTVAEAGTCAAALLLDRVTTVPAAGAGPLRVTVPPDALPPITLAGFNDTPASSKTGATVSTAFCVTPL